MNHLFLDLETTGLESDKDSIVIGGFKYNDEPTYVEYPPFSEKTRRLLADKDTAIVGHNILFDIAFLEKGGYEIQGPILDTRILAFAKWPLRKLKLKSLAKEVLGIEAVEFKSIKGKKKIQDIDKNILEGYVKQDVELAYKLFQLLYPQRSDWLENVELPLTTHIHNIQNRGLYTNVGEVARLNSEWSISIGDIVSTYQPVNLNSPKQVAERLKQDIGETKSTDKLALLDYKDKSQFAKDMLQYRELSTLVNRYTKSILEINKDGYIHGEFNQAGQEKNEFGVKTGRLSSSNPNLQNIPSRSGLGKSLRKCFIAPRGKKLIVADYGQIEPRLVTWYTRDRKLLEIYQTGKDFHDIITQLAYNKSKFTKDERFVGKTLGLASIYGAGTGILRLTLKKYGINLSYGDVDRLRTRIRANFTDTLGWIQTFQEKTRYSGAFATYGGRVYPYDPDLALFNCLIQGSAADVMKLAINNLEVTGYEVISTIHDEALFYVDMDKAEASAKEIKEIMESVVSLHPIKLVAEVSICDSWAEK